MKFGCSAVAPRIWRARAYVRVFNLLPISSSDGSFLNSHSPAYRNSCPRSRPPSIARVDQRPRNSQPPTRRILDPSLVCREFFSKNFRTRRKTWENFSFLSRRKAGNVWNFSIVIGGRADRRGWDKWINLITRQGE